MPVRDLDANELEAGEIVANVWLIGAPKPTRDGTVQMRRLLSRAPELLAVLEVHGMNEMSTPSVPGQVEPVPAEVKAAFASIRALGATTVRSMGPHASPPAQLLVTVHAGVTAQIDEVNRLVEVSAASNAMISDRIAAPVDAPDSAVRRAGRSLARQAGCVSAL